MFIFVLFILLIAIAVIGIYIWIQKCKERRKKELSGWAFSHNLNFSDTNDGEMEERYPHFKCLQQGNRRYGYNIMEGSIDNRKVCAFDYHYETSDGKNTHHYYFSAVILETNLPLKPLFIRNENFLDKVADFFGFDDINFESVEFSKQFYVKSPDKKWAYDVLNQETMEFLLGSSRFYLDFHGKHVIAYRKSVFTVSDFEDALHVITGILDRLPKSVVQELQGGK
jgi:hypothetical protein